MYTVEQLNGANSVLERIAAANQSDPVSDDLTVPLAVELAEKSAEIERLLGACKDKAELLAAAYAQLAAARAEVVQVTGYRDGLVVINRQLEAEIERLTRLLKGIAEYCSGDDRTLGAIERLATIRNTVDRELRGVEQSAPRSEGGS